MENENRTNSELNLASDLGESFKTMFSEADSETSLVGSRNSAENSPSSDTEPSLNYTSNQELPKTIGSLKIPRNKNTESSNVHTNADLRASVSSSKRVSFSKRARDPLAAVTTQTHRPPIQMMEKTGTYGRNQKMVSFRSRSLSMNWSTVSNDSLFSLPVGIDSIRMDPSSRMSTGLLCRSGEMHRYGERFKSNEMFLSREFYLSSELKQSRELQNSDNHEIADRDKDSVAEEETNMSKEFSDVSEASNYSGNDKYSRESCSSSSSNLHSYQSEFNNQGPSSSKDKGRCCGWTNCCCKCPMWSLCSCFKWPSCCCSGSKCCCPCWCFGSKCCRTWCTCCCPKSPKRSNLDSFYPCVALVTLPCYITTLCSSTHL